MAEERTVFVSYAHESEEHVARVALLVRRLNRCGVPVVFDGDLEFEPTEGWLAWMERAFEAASHVLVVASPSYPDPSVTSSSAPHRGASWEASMVYSELYNGHGKSERIVVVGLVPGALETVPRPLADSVRFDLSEPMELGKLSDYLVAAMGYPGSVPRRHPLCVDSAGRELVGALTRPVSRDVVGCRVLLVDDDERLVSFIRRSLERLGARATSALDGGSALEVFEVGAFDIVVTDWKMDVLDGLDLSAALGERDPDLPVVLITGHAGDQLLASGIQVLEKPLPVDELCRVICDEIRGDLGRVAKSWDDWGLAYGWMGVARRLVSAFFETNIGGQGFVAAYRHKMKDRLSALAEGLGRSFVAESICEQFVVGAGKVVRLAERLEYGVGLGTLAFFGALRDDITNEEPEIDVDFELESAVLANVGPDQQRTLVLGAAELVDNALAALEGAGRLSVRLSRRRSAPEVRLSVWSSTSIAKDVGDRVMEAGVSSKGSGRGMGLAIVNELACTFGGGLAWRSSRGGVEFILTLPATAGGQPPAPDALDAR